MELLTSLHSNNDAYRLEYCFSDRLLDDVSTITAYARDMKDFLQESELTERRAFIESFVKEIIVIPGDALIRYTVPMPDDSF